MAPSPLLSPRPSFGSPYKDSRADIRLEARKALERSEEEVKMREQLEEQIR
jgi:hypothetical protein